MSSTRNEVDDFLGGPGLFFARFPDIGDTVSGVVCRQPYVTEQVDMNGDVKRYEDGNPMKMLVVPIEVEDGREVCLAVKGSLDPASKSMRAAITAALNEADARLQVGGRLTVVYIGDGEPARPGFFAPKQYRASYEKPRGA